MHIDHAGQGVDQLAQVMHSYYLVLKHPNDCRIIISAWNPAGEYVYLYGCGAALILVSIFCDCVLKIIGNMPQTGVGA